MRALLEQIEELDGNEVYGRVVGVRGLMVEVAGPLHAMSVGARVVIETRSRASRADPLRGGRLFRRQCAADAVCAAGRGAARLPGGGVGGAGGGAAVAGLARPGRQRHGRADRRQGPAAVGADALSVPGVAAGRPCPQARRRSDRSRRPRAQHLHHLLPRPAHGHLLRLRRRQVGAAVDAGAQRRRRRLGDRADRRARPRGAGIPPGRPRRSRAWPARSWWWRPPTSRR